MMMKVPCKFLQGDKKHDFWLKAKQNTVHDKRSIYFSLHFIYFTCTNGLTVNSEMRKQRKTESVPKMLVFFEMPVSVGVTACPFVGRILRLSL